MKQFVLLALVACASEPHTSSIITLSPLADDTDSLTISVTGTAPANTVVDVSGGASAVKVMSDPLGAFTAPVALTLGQSNTLRAVLPDGQQSEARTVLQRVPRVNHQALQRSAATPLRIDAPPTVDNGIAVVRGYTTPSAQVVVTGGEAEVMISADDSGLFTAHVALVHQPDVLLNVAAFDASAQPSATIQLPVSQAMDALVARAPQLDNHVVSIKGSRATIRGTADAGMRVRAEENGEVLADTFASSLGIFALGLSLTPGEHSIDVRAVAADGTVSSADTVLISRATTRQASAYPIILVHGMGGWDNIAGYTYFYGIEQDLRELGFEVYTASMTPFATPETRARQLKSEILAFTSGKVNIIAHSQGTIDARYMISKLDMGDRVASYTSIAGPHRGSRVADVAVGLIPGPAELAIDFLAKLLKWEWASVHALTEHAMVNTFNPTVLDDPRVYYQSWTGAADPFGRQTGTALSAYLVAPWLVLEATKSGVSDGLVSEASGKWGKWRGTMPADHITEVGQVFGWVHGFDYKGFYEDIAIELTSFGY